MHSSIAGLQITAPVRCQSAQHRRPVRVQAAAATEIKAGAAAKRKQLGDSDLQVSREHQMPLPCGNALYHHIAHRTILPARVLTSGIFTRRMLPRDNDMGRPKYRKRCAQTAELCIDRHGLEFHGHRRDLPCSPKVRCFGVCNLGQRWQLLVV